MKNALGNFYIQTAVGNFYIHLSHGYSILFSHKSRVATVCKLPRPRKVKNALGNVFIYHKKKAFETAKKLLEINPKNQLVHLALYKFYLDEGSHDKAINSMKIALQSSKINPDSKIKVLADFVKFVSKNQQYEQDLVDVTAMLTKIESSGKTLVELAQYYLLKGEKQKAINFYEQALQ